MPEDFSKRQLSLLPSKRDPARDFKHPRYASAVEMAPIPRSFSVANQQPIRDQGNAPFCVGFALAALMGVGILKADLVRVLSPVAIYNGARSLENPPPVEGTSIRDALIFTQRNGVCFEEDQPFKGLTPSYPGALAVAHASLTRIGGWAEVNNTTIDIKAALARGGGNLIAAIGVTPGFDSPGANGVLVGGGSDRGSHAINIVGYNDDIGGGSFRVRNSWGTGWAEGGFAWMPYAMARAVITEVYTASVIVLAKAVQLNWFQQLLASLGFH